jgi:hypothetical protein
MGLAPEAVHLEEQTTYFWPLKSLYRTRAEIPPIARLAKTNNPVKKISSASNMAKF